MRLRVRRAQTISEARDRSLSGRWSDERHFPSLPLVQDQRLPDILPVLPSQQPHIRRIHARQPANSPLLRALLGDQRPEGEDECWALEPHTPGHCRRLSPGSQPEYGSNDLGIRVAGRFQSVRPRQELLRSPRQTGVHSPNQVHALLVKHGWHRRTIHQMRRTNLGTPNHASYRISPRVDAD